MQQIATLRDFIEGIALHTWKTGIPGKLQAAIRQTAGFPEKTYSVSWFYKADGQRAIFEDGAVIDHKDNESICDIVWQNLDYAQGVFGSYGIYTAGKKETANGSGLRIDHSPLWYAEALADILNSTEQYENITSASEITNSSRKPQRLPSSTVFDIAKKYSVSDEAVMQRVKSYFERKHIADRLLANLRNAVFEGNEDRIYDAKERFSIASESWSDNCSAVQEYNSIISQE